MNIINYIKNRKWKYKFNYMKLRCGDFVSIDSVGEGIITDTYLTRAMMFICKPTFGCPSRSRLEIPYDRITGKLDYEISKDSNWNLYDFVEYLGSIYCLSWDYGNGRKYHGVLVDTVDKNKMNRKGRTELVINVHV